MGFDELVQKLGLPLAMVVAALLSGASGKVWVFVREVTREREIAEATAKVAEARLAEEKERSAKCEALAIRVLGRLERSIETTDKAVAIVQRQANGGTTT